MRTSQGGLSRRRVLMGSAAIGAIGLVRGNANRAEAAPVGPSDLTLPSQCRIVAPDRDNGWLIDCGSADNPRIRSALQPALISQGWSSVASGLATSAWLKGETRLVVSEGSGGIGGLPRFSIRRIR
jgi:hypothetical protein